MSEAPETIWATMENRRQWHLEKPKGEVMSHYSHQYTRTDAITPAMAAKVLHYYFEKGEFEYTGDASMQEVINAGITCQYTLTENWLRAIAEQEGEA